jgi:tetratricopeptide (TPR) repeat protein
MMKNKVINIILLLFLLGTGFAHAQKAERDYIRKGNRLYKDSVYVKAEVDYRKALDVNPKSTISMYNLGNALLQQKKAKEAMEQYVGATKIEKDKSRLAHIYHNMGVIFQSAKDYAKAVEAYKQSLRNNPKDNETRYNLALAQKMLKDQQQKNKNQDKNKDKDKDKDKKDKKDQNKNQNNKDQKQDQQKNKNQQQPPQQQKKDNQMSKQNAEQLLNSVLQDEKGVQDKVKKQKVIQGGRLEKDW